MICLHICGAYLYRLSRRHSTLLLIASFIVTITVILHLYSHRHQTRQHLKPRVGDFDYRPGSFLRGQQANENKSYCEFNYGLPDSLQWDKVQECVSPEIGIKSPYRVIYNAISGRAYKNHSKYDAVTYATQATPEYLYHLLEIARYWDGPISIAVFVPGYDLDITMQIMKQLCHCYEGMSKVSVHLFYPSINPPVIRPKQQIATTTEIHIRTTNRTAKQLEKQKLLAYRNLNGNARNYYIQWVRRRKLARMMQKMPNKRSEAPYLVFEDCSGMASFDIPTFRRERSLVYLINVGRNIARNASLTNYFIVSDIEMVPSDGLATKFLTMLRKLMGDKKREEGCVFAKTVFVVPLFEVEKGEEIPHDKYTLVQLVEANRAKYFHQRQCTHCQRFPGLQSWLLRPPTDVIEPFLIAKREYPYHRWEPLYFGTHKEPWYNEMLSWEGRQDKMTQMLELCLQEYSFITLDGGFMIHSNYTMNLEWTYEDFLVYTRETNINWFNLKSIMLELCLQEYRMVVLDGGFLCHAAAPKSSNHHQRAEKINAHRYLKIIGAFKQKYPDRPQCKVNWGQPMMDWWGVLKNTFV